jgi:hypothetical protein
MRLPWAVLLLALLAARYLHWRITATLNLDTPLAAALSVLLLGAELWLLAHGFLLLLFSLAPELPRPVQAPDGQDDRPRGRLPLVRVHRRPQGRVADLDNALCAARFPGGIRHVGVHGVLEYGLLLRVHGRVGMCNEADLEAPVRGGDGDDVMNISSPTGGRCTWPAAGGQRPLTRRRKEVLPQPEGPTTSRRWLRSMVRLRSWISSRLLPGGTRST